MLVGYMLVSVTDTQHTIALQHDALVAADVDPADIHRDHSSGRKDNRPALRACVDILRANDVLIIWKLDRPGRSLSHLLTIVADLNVRGIALRSLDEQIDTTTPAGQMLFGFVDILARYERAVIAERVNVGLAAARQRGSIGGRRPTLDADQIDRIIVTLDNGESKATVCRLFNVARSTLLGTLERAGWQGP